MLLDLGLPDGSGLELLQNLPPKKSAARHYPNFTSV